MKNHHILDTYLHTSQETFLLFITNCLYLFEQDASNVSKEIICQGNKVTGSCSFGECLCIAAGVVEYSTKFVSHYKTM